MSVVAEKTWRIITLVNSAINSDGDLINLPYPGTFTEQPQWFTDAVQIVRTERARHREEQMKNG